MLKIKDNVNLKELEKFGFKPAINVYYKYSYIKNIGSTCRIKINKNRFLETWNCFNNFDHDEVDKTINDLIKADLVVKVDE